MTATENPSPIAVAERSTREAPLDLPRAALEDWMREYYFETEIDIGGSGVEDFRLRDLRDLLGIARDEIDEIVFHDSQTLGGPSIRKALSERFLDGDPEGVIVTHGSTEANHLVMYTLLRRGDEVVVFDPCYTQLEGIAESLGCRVRASALRWENGFRPDLDEVESLITPATRMVVVNFPHNPTGATLTPEERDRLLQAVERTGAYLVWDGAFTDLTYDAPPLRDPVLDYERTLSMGTLSKAYGLPGMRVGWCLGSPELLAPMIRVRDYTTLHLSPLVETLAERAIAGADRILELRRAQARRNRDLLGRWVEEHRELVSWTPPEGGVCGLIRFDERVGDVESFCHRLARRERLLLVPGSCFNHPRHARLGFGGATQELEEGLRRLGSALVDMT